MVKRVLKLMQRAIAQLPFSQPMLSRPFLPARTRPVRQLALPVLFLLLAGCGGQSNSLSSPSVRQSPTTQTDKPATASAPASPDKPVPNATPAAPQSLAAPISPPSPKLTTVTVYQADDQCVNFVPEQVQVSADRPMQGAVGKVLEKQGDGDFDLGGYRVSINAQTGEATVDLRLVPGSKRQIVSLSACEQFALFGSLRETLMKNPAWNVKSVRFTERGEEIVL